MKRAEIERRERFEVLVVMRLSESQVSEMKCTEICWTNYPAGTTGRDQI
jgi:hypothetical protein